MSTPDERTKRPRGRDGHGPQFGGGRPGGRGYGRFNELRRQLAAATDPAVDREEFLQRLEQLAPPGSQAHAWFERVAAGEPLDEETFRRLALAGISAGLADIPADVWQQGYRALVGDDLSDAAARTTLASLVQSRSVPELYDTFDEAPVSQAGHAPEAFFGVHEVRIDSVGDLLHALAALQIANGHLRLVWRGQQDVAWQVRSSLSRRAARVSEDELLHAEEDYFVRAAMWGEGTGSPLQLFADLQHNGAPTRLLDASMDPEVAAWFAVEADEELDQRDARLIAWARGPVVADGTPIALPAEPNDDSSRPFWHAWKSRDERIDVEWGTGTRTWSWFPMAFNERMRSQRAGFLFEAEPILSDDVTAIFSTRLGEQWSAAEIAGATSVLGIPSRHDVRAAPNRANVVPLFSFRIAAAAKPAIREHLLSKGLTEQTIYPDRLGLISHLRRRYGKR